MQFHMYLLWVNVCYVLIVLSVVNVKGLVGTFNHEMSLVGAFSVNVNLREVSFPALLACEPGAW